MVYLNAERKRQQDEAVMAAAILEAETARQVEEVAAVAAVEAADKKRKDKERQDLIADMALLKKKNGGTGEESAHGQSCPGSEAHGGGGGMKGRVEEKSR